MKVIFLDVDGVLCTARSYMAYDIPKNKKMWNSWDDIGCIAIREVCWKGVLIVVSSTWRRPRHEVELREHMTKHGLIEFLHEDWKTPDYTYDPNYETPIRGDEIRAWLKNHPEVEDYKILDDIDQFYEDQQKKFIHTDESNGMSTENIRELYRWAGVLKS